jgi:natural resistance-associated macrophage protein
VAESLKYNAIESGLALFVSFLINLAVVATFAVSYFTIDCATRSDFQACVPLLDLPPTFINPNGTGYIKNVTQTCTPSAFSGTLPPQGFVCADIGLSNAGDALGNLFPGTKAAKYIWGVGLLAAGQASTVTGTYAGQFVMAGFLDIKIKAWQRMLFTRLVALGPAVVIAWLTQGYPNISDQTSEYLNVLQSVQLPFALLPVLHITNRGKYMGEFKNSKFLKTVCWLLALLVMVTNVYLIFQSVNDSSNLIIGIVITVGVFYFYFITVIIRSDIMAAWHALCRCGGEESRR